MAGTQVQLRRGTTAEHASFTGAVGEVTVDTTKDTVVVHDGSTAGGFPLAREHQISAGNSSVAVTDTGSNGTVVVTTEGTERMRVDSSGNVGIGTNSPDENFKVTIASSGGTYAGTLELFGTVYKFSYSDSSSGVIGTGSNHPLRFWTNNTERMRITAAGDVGIGTSSPDNFAGYGNLAINGSTGGNIDFQSGGTTTAYVAGNSTSAALFSVTSIPLQFGTNDTPRMTIDANGNVEIGTTGQTGGKGFYVFADTIGNTQNAGVGCDAKSGASNWRSAYIFVEKHSGITNPVAVLELWAEDAVPNYIWADNSDILRISTTRAHIGTTSGTVVGAQTSDERLKNISGPVQYGLQEVLALEPISFTMRDDTDETPKIGFSAQQVQPIIPEAVFDTNIEIEEGQPTKLGMEYVNLIPVLTKAIQEQQAIINDLTARLEALENA